ncbi:type II toxin-antitoxin system RelE/ParE family toxin [Methylovulum miyakonense]|uniref:type II toxin-antitoxin system RelE/ParE family toxin n=1 Tax=Methylovulum miyakonense TaxID=645578 RepID=UPI00037579E8|nr:type II toxin-antitoxin system RelE/ParE family toxin [Methylovulum miyakonense]
MKRYAVIIMPEAENNLQDAYSFIAQDSPRNALQWYLQMRDAIQTLETLPLRCPLAPEDNVFEEEIRQLIVGNYRLLYSVRDPKVYILHIRHSARRWLSPE